MVNELVTLTSKSHNGCTNTKKLKNIFHFRTLEEPKKNIPLMQSQVQVQLQLQLQLMHDRPKLFRFRVAQFVASDTCGVRGWGLGCLDTLLKMSHQKKLNIMANMYTE